MAKNTTTQVSLINRLDTQAMTCEALLNELRKFLISSKVEGSEPWIQEIDVVLASSVDNWMPFK